MLSSRIALAVVGLCTALTVFIPSSTTAQQNAPARIAITIDDIPWNGGDESEQQRLNGTDEMIAALRRHNAPMAVFVVCDRLQPHDAVLARWVAAGATIGNHTARHQDLNTTPVRQWTSDVRRCDAKLREATGVRTRYFRFPFLHEGATPEQMSAARAVLRELNYQNAHVTIDNSDIAAVRPYSAARRQGHAEGARTIAAAALAHDLAAAEHFRQFARQKVGREVPHIILLHANLMTASILAPLLDSLRQRGYQFISLQEALSDPVFQRPTCYAGRRGFSFLYRIAPCAREEDAWDVAAQTQLIGAVSRTTR